MPDLHRRSATSHERQAGAAWDASYADGSAPWDIGRPQPAFQRLADAGAFTGPVLDAGCGSGEHGLMCAALGLEVVGVDVAPTALEMAREKAAARGLRARFDVADALQLGRLERRFDTVIDCGLLHTFDGDERRAYVAGLVAVTAPGATVHILCFSDAGPELGPHPVPESELRAAFDEAGQWRVRSLAADRIHTRFGPDGLPAWLAQIVRT